MEGFEGSFGSNLEGFARAQVLSSYIQMYMRTLFTKNADDLNELLLSGLIDSHGVRLLYEIAILREVHRLYKEVNGDIEAAIVQARERAEAL